MQRYFKDTNLDIFELSNDDSYHIIKVMRNKIGDNIEVVIDKKLYIWFNYNIYIIYIKHINYVIICYI